ncbi:MAG: DUF1016 N-terminal domain-containing protein [Elusimicrobia bacterium]|nr:DUF1016 N-terminal domain-containing protein [Elusimicrobiota bacterium]
MATGKQTKKTVRAASQPPAVVDEAALLCDLRELIQSARQRVATVANSTHTMLCWHVGRRLLKDNLQYGRAAYGKRILATVSQQLQAEFGEGYTYSALTRMIRFAETQPNETIVSRLSTQYRTASHAASANPSAPGYRARPGAGRHTRQNTGGKVLIRHFGDPSCR